MGEEMLGEIGRRFRVVDMMLTAHSVLRDRYAIRARVIEITFLGVSTILVAATFIDPAVLKDAGVDVGAARNILGVASITVFLLSLIQWHVDWKERAGAHHRACSTLGNLKAQCRALKTDFSIDADGAEVAARKWFDDMDGAMKGLPAIPDKEFNALKARHLRKVEVSRLLDSYPGTPVSVLRIKVWYKGLVASLHGEDA
jgi:hypothetical protein